MSTKSFLDRILATSFLAIAIALVAFFSFFLLLFLSMGICWLIGVDTDGSNMPGVVSAISTLCLLAFIYYRRHTMSENLLRKEDMFIWPIAYLLLFLPIGIPFVKLVTHAAIHRMQRIADDKVETLTEMIERTEELKDGSILMDTAAMRKDTERAMQNADLNWQDVSDEKAGFTAKFPQGKVEKDVVDNRVDGDMPSATQYSIDLKGQLDANSGYWIATYKIPLGSSMKEMFDKTEKQLTKGVETVLYAKDAQVSGYIARDLKIKLNSFEIMHVRLAYYKSNIYIIRVLAPIDNADNDAVIHFFNSFQPV